MKRERILGENLKRLLPGIEAQEAFMHTMRYTLPEFQKLCDGRLFATRKDVDDMASFLKVSPEDLFIKRTGNIAMHCMGNFNKPENMEKVLNIFDMYCDLQEALD